MLRADVMPRAEDAALQKRKRALNRVGMNVAVNVNAPAVIHGLVARLEVRDRLLVCPKFVGNDHVNVLAHVLADVAGESAGRNIFGVEEAQIAVALADADHDFLAALAAPVDLLRAILRVHILRLAADERLVNLNRAVQHRAIRLTHRAADAVAEIPSRLVANAERALDLIRAHSLARLAEQIDGDEPLKKREMRVVEDRVSCDRKLIVAVRAVVEFLFRLKPNDRAFAAQTFHAVGEAQTL